MRAKTVKSYENKGEIRSKKFPSSGRGVKILVPRSKKKEKNIYISLVITDILLELNRKKIIRESFNVTQKNFAN